MFLGRSIVLVTSNIAWPLEWDSAPFRFNTPRGGRLENTNFIFKIVLKNIILLAVLICKILLYHSQIKFISKLHCAISWIYISRWRDVSSSVTMKCPRQAWWWTILWIWTQTLSNLYAVTPITNPIQSMSKHKATDGIYLAMQQNRLNV